MKYLILILLILLPVTAFASTTTGGGGGGGGWSSWSWQNWPWGPVTTSSVIITYGDYLIANGNYYLLSSTQHYQVGH